MTIQGTPGQKLPLTPIAKGEFKASTDALKPEAAEAEALKPQALDGVAIGSTQEREEALHLVKHFPTELHKVDLQAWGDALKEMDHDGDHAISEQEFVANYLKNHPPGPESMGCGTAHYAVMVQMAKMMFSGIDSNKDGKITLSESDGLPKPQSVELDLPGILPTIDFKKSDADGDGKLSKAEFYNAVRDGMNGFVPIGMHLDENGKPVTLLSQAFDNIDQDGDGAITVDEAEQFGQGVSAIYQTMWTEAKAPLAADR